jgi:hypothetical protein
MLMSTIDGGCSGGEVIMFEVDRLTHRRDPFLVVMDKRAKEEFYVAVWKEPGYHAKLEAI